MGQWHSSAPTSHWGRVLAVVQQASPQPGPHPQPSFAASAAAAGVAQQPSPCQASRPSLTATSPVPWPVAVLTVNAGYRLVRDSGRVFMEAAPAGVHPEELGL
jgi:hypothetical protein